MKSAKHVLGQIGAAKRGFDVSLAGWILSAATFLLGSVIQPLYSKLTFDGISVAQLSRLDVRYSHSGVFEVSTVLKIANASASAVTIEAISAKVEGFISAQLSSLGATAFIAKEARTDLHDNIVDLRSRDLPILLKKETTELLVAIVAIQASGFDSGTFEEKKARSEAVANELRRHIALNGMSLSLTVNDKIQELRVRNEANRPDFPTDRMDWRN